MTDFKHIGIIGRIGSERTAHSLKRLTQFLLGRSIQVTLEDETATMLPATELAVCSRDELGKRCDLIVVVGGDGSLLGAARALARHDVPILGINRGRLGFLTDITPHDLEQRVAEVLAGKYATESRFLLDMVVCRDGVPVGSGDALNDVVLHPGEFIRMIEFETYVDGQFVHSQRSDGIIISTPTGSTAYALSGGGPIMHPKLDAIALVPMNPHTLSSRPIVVDGNSEIRIVLSEHNTTSPRITCDGQVHVPIQSGDVIHVHKKPHKLKLLHPLNHNFYESCRSKLGWGSHLGSDFNSSEGDDL